MRNPRSYVASAFRRTASGPAKAGRHARGDHTPPVREAVVGGKAV
jgi:hypothetical protein